MHQQTRNWTIFTFITYLVMYMLIPLKAGPRVYPFGFYLGFMQAVILNFFAYKNYKLWKMPGSILIFGIPLLTCLAWIPTSIIFAYYYPYGKKLFWKTSYILLFAVGTTIVQYIHGLIGMWESKRWKPIYTFPLAIATHTIMAVFLPLFKLDKIREIK